MEPSKENFRFYIFTRMKLGYKAKEIHEELNKVFGDVSPSFDTVAWWIRYFDEGGESVKDEERSGRPCSSLTKETVARADAIVAEDRCITLWFLASELGVSLGSAHSIMHKELGRSKRCARWVPHMLTEEQCQERVWISKLWLQMFAENGPRWISDVVTGDECWISFFTNKDKSSNMAWLAEDDPRTEVLKTGFRSRKRM